MRKFVVLSRITGRRGINFESGSEINETQINPGSIDSLINRGFIKEKTWDAPITGKIKLAIVTSIWKRPEIFTMFMKGFTKLLSLDNFEISLIISQSILNGDNTYNNSNDPSSWRGFFSLLNLQNFKIIEIPNEPLATKVNATTYACRNLDVHYILCLGSDDIMSPELLNEYAKYMRKGIDFIGITDCYFYDLISKKSIYWAGYREPKRKGNTVGAFRCISSQLMDRLDWMPWDSKLNSCLDRSMMISLSKLSYTSHLFSIKEKNLFAIDIKSETNITPFKKWDNSEYIDSEVIKKQFNYIF